MSTLLKKVFSVAPVKRGSSLGLKLLRFSCFRECWLRSRRSQFNKNTFSKKNFSYERFRYVSALWKKLKQHQWNILFLRAQFTHIVLFLRILVWKRSKFTDWQLHHLLKNIFIYGSFRYVFTLCKKVVSMTAVKYFSLWPKLVKFTFFRECRFGRD